MQAKAKASGEVIVVELTGQVDLDTAEPFRQICLKKLVNRKIVFNLSGLNFVGSNGITPFLTTLRVLQKTLGDGVKMCGVQAEFRKIFAANFSTELELYENEAIATRSFTEPQPTIPLVQMSEFEEINRDDDEYISDSQTIPLLPDNAGD